MIKSLIVPLILHPNRSARVSKKLASLCFSELRFVFVLLWFRLVNLRRQVVELVLRLVLWLLCFALLLSA